MLAALLADRFLIFKEADLIALNIPYDLRRRTQDRALALRAERPFNPIHMPQMTPPAYAYLDNVETAQRESRTSNNKLRKLQPRYLELKVSEAKRDRYTPPLCSADAEVLRLWNFHWRYINDWHDSCERYYLKMTAQERLWFADLPQFTRWAGDFPLLAPAPQCFYPLEETPERARQIYLVKWVIADCGGEA